jgi:KaiC/GvpD/RAD55 family RecA-like ATPase
VTELVRTLKSGRVGLDLVLGGGFRLLRRVEGSASESATVLIRGGPGAGKSVFAAEAALRLAHALGGDVLYVCIEILPREILAQRMGFEGFDPARAIDLADPVVRKVAGDGPTLVVGMTEMDFPTEGGTPDLGRMIVDLVRLSVERGCDPRVVVVDSLSDGYELGSRVPRPVVDGVCKLAVEQGWVLILVEEALDHRASYWSFAVDTVLSLEVTREGRRELRVTKHRFAPCQPGPHRLLLERAGVRVIPSWSAYRDAHRDLDFPLPATRRSLRSVAQHTPTLDLPDGEGRTVFLHMARGEPALDRTAERLGTLAPNGAATPGARIYLALTDESSSYGLTNGEFRQATLRPMVDGEEWLEGALSTVAAQPSPLVRVRVGPTDAIDMHREIPRAVGMLAGILVRRGIFVLVHGGLQPPGIIRPGIDEMWDVASTAPHLKLYRTIGSTSTSLDVVW